MVALNKKPDEALNEVCRGMPSDEDVARYHERGYHVTPLLYSRAEIDSVREAIERFYDGDYDFPLLENRLKPFLGSSSGQGQRTNDYASLLMRGLAEFIAKPILGRIAARLSGSDEIRLWHDQLIHKPSACGDSGIGWHTDRSYWHTCTSSKMITAWVPLCDVDETIGTLLYIPGSHRNSSADAHHLRGFHIADLDTSAAELKAGPSAPLFDPHDAVPMVLECGQVSFHHAGTVHGSAPNLGDRPRLSLSVHLQDGDNAYRRPADEKLGKHIWHRNDVLCRKHRANGNPDYSDPVICPRLYPTS